MNILDYIAAHEIKIQMNSRWHHAAKGDHDKGLQQWSCARLLRESRQSRPNGVFLTINFALQSIGFAQAIQVQLVHRQTPSLQIVHALEPAEGELSEANEKKEGTSDV